MRYCVECGNPIQENGFPDKDKDDDVPVILFSDPPEYYHDSCFTMMAEEGKIKLSTEQRGKLFGTPN